MNFILTRDKAITIAPAALKLSGITATASASSRSSLHPSRKWI